MFRCNYPEDFYNYNDGVNISIKEINKWIDECIERLEKCTDSDSMSISSGNTKVMVVRLNDEYRPYDITVCKNYLEYAPYMNNNDED
jgi:hypothetical protein